MENKYSIGIIGAGTWGMALARSLCMCGHNVTVWSALPEEIDQLNRDRKQVNLPYMVIPDEIVFTKDISLACNDKDILLFAVPSPFVRSTAKAVAPYVSEGQIIVDVAKGIEAGSHAFLSEVILSEIPGASVVVLSGPTHAEEVAKDLPTTIVAAHADKAIAEKVQKAFTSPYLRVFTNTDVRGIELCGALKNIIALAAGISDGLGYGDNIKAALITLGLGEIKRLGEKMGCSHETIYGLTGMGDLIVTATSVHSRNNRCGHLLGQGLSVEEAVKQVGMVVEGINALPAAMSLSEQYGIDMPIVFGVDKIVNQGVSAKDVARDLLERELSAEIHSQR
ncbi:MAG: NAD(P)-dependent glycerol-3-phosphate dehydrogenase [Saccharofermentans sp.]|nr:NAD(P)-dependent glycerol-3-phosphate dehydrogenase [Saccharofermentans sp.]